MTAADVAALVRTRAAREGGLVCQAVADLYGSAAAWSYQGADLRAVCRELADAVTDEGAATVYRFGDGSAIVAGPERWTTEEPGDDPEARFVRVVLHVAETQGREAADKLLQDAAARFGIRLTVTGAA